MLTNAVKILARMEEFVKISLTRIIAFVNMDLKV